MITETTLNKILKMLVLNRMVIKVTCAIYSDHDDYKLNDYGKDTTIEIKRGLLVGEKHRAIMATPIIVITKK